MIRRVALILGLALSFAPAVPGQDTPAAPETAAFDDALSQEVLAIFERSCADCHDISRRSRPKGGFGHVLDLGKLAAGDYVVAGKPADSDLYTVLTDPDPDIVMPPPDSEAPKLTKEEIALVARWITQLGKSADTPPSAGNTPPSDASAPPSPVTLTAPTAPATTSTSATDVPKPATAYIKPSPGPKTLFARTHPMVVHFPIALLLLAVVVEWLGWVSGRRAAWLPGVKWMLGASAVTAPVAALAGWFLVGPAGHSDKDVFLHRWLGVSTAAVAIVCWILLVVAERRDCNRLRLVARVLLLIAAVLVGVAGHTGGELVYGPGYPF